MKPFLLALGLFSLNSPDVSLSTSVPSEARTFLIYMLAKDEQKLMEFTRHREIFFTGAKLNRDIYEFLYEPDVGWNSVVDIAKMDELMIKPIEQENGNIIVLYYPKKYRWQIDNDLDFLQKEWMKKYFACEFTLRDTKLMLVQNFCFAETDGPFPPAY